MNFELIELGAVSQFFNNLRKPVTRSSRVSGDYRYFGAAGVQDYVAGFLFDGDYILVGEDGTVITEEDRPVVQQVTGKFWVNNHAHVIQPLDMNDFDYMYYALSAANVRELVTGAVQPKLSMTNLKQLLIPWPKDSSVRIQIGSVLKHLDLTIQNNNDLSETLENISQSIFKSWFIDFDPVKAKLAGEKPLDMNEETATLFPEAMEESEFGAIPKTWSWSSIGEIAEVIDCLHSKKPELLSEGLPYLQLDTISDRGVLLFDKSACISEADYKKWTSRIEVRGGDCVITNVGRVGAVSQVPNHFRAAIGRNITALRPKNQLLHQSFLIVALLSDYMKLEITKNTDAGTILEALNVRNIPKLRIPAPSDALLLEFAKACDPIRSQIQALYSLNVKLESIRDALLPRLVSGELQIPNDMVA
jgi:type I restriction enzyme S subunit